MKLYYTKSDEMNKVISMMPQHKHNLIACVELACFVFSSPLPPQKGKKIFLTRIYLDLLFLSLMVFLLLFRMDLKSLFVAAQKTFSFILCFQFVVTSCKLHQFTKDKVDPSTPCLDGLKMIL